MAQTYTPFLGNFDTYGAGPEHDFFLEGLLTGDQVLNSDPTVSPGTTSPGPTNDYSSADGGPGDGSGGLGIGPAGPNASETTTDLAGFIGSIAAVPTGFLGAVNTVNSIATNKDPARSLIGDIVNGLMGNPTVGEVENAMNSPAFGGGDVGPSQGPSTDVAIGGVDPGFDGTSASSDQGSSQGSDVDGGDPGGGADAAYAGGGFIPGDSGGMDDSVPAMIDGMEPAAISEGEFVIPADIVAMLGDGNSNAGAKKIEKAISQIRKAKYGRDKQPPKMQRSLADLLT